jgi:hypothetical protein
MIHQALAEAEQDGGLISASVSDLVRMSANIDPHHRERG